MSAFMAYLDTAPWEFILAIYALVWLIAELVGRRYDGRSRS